MKTVTNVIKKEIAFNVEIAINIFLFKFNFDYTYKQFK